MPRLRACAASPDPKPSSTTCGVIKSCKPCRSPYPASGRSIASSKSTIASLNGPARSARADGASSSHDELANRRALDVSSVPADPEGKQQHVVETLNVL